MTALDLALLGLVALMAFGGFRRGLVTGILSVTGLVVGAYLGARLAPGLLGLDDSPYLPIATLAGAVICAGLVQAVAVLGGRTLRASVIRPSPLRAVDDIGGAVLGVVTGLLLCWAIGAVLLYLPGQTELRRHAQDSLILSTLNGEFPPSRFIDALASVDPFSVIAGPEAAVDPPDPSIVDSLDVRYALDGVVHVYGDACGLGLSGSAWIVAPELVATNAHVVAGIDRPTVDRRDNSDLAAAVVAFDPENDVAVLWVPGLRGRPLATADPEPGTSVAILGFPEQDGLTVVPARLGATVLAVGQDAYGRLRPRTVTAIRGTIRPGNSGGPLVDEYGRVRGMVFAGRKGSAESGYAVPVDRVLKVVRSAGRERLVTDCAR